jgi:hypothetical protein
MVCLVRAAPGPAYASLHLFISAVTCPCRTYMQAEAVKCDCKETTTLVFHVRLCYGTPGYRCRSSLSEPIT